MDMTVDDLKKEIKGYNYEALTGGDDSVGERCIEKATLWVTAKVRKCGVKIDLDDDIVKQAILKRALYELYSFAENEGLAADKKEDAIELLRAYFGNCIDDQIHQAQGREEKGLPVVFVQPGRTDWKKFK